MTTPFPLPDSGELLLTIAQVGEVLGQSESQTWCDLKNVPGFPQPIRRGPRYTRIRASELRVYIANLGAGTPKIPPKSRGRAAK